LVSEDFSGGIFPAVCRFIRCVIHTQCAKVNPPGPPGCSKTVRAGQLIRDFS
jgi:hypothetical protein